MLVKRQCQNCSEFFEVESSRLKYDPALFHSRDCHHEYRRKQIAPRLWARIDSSGGLDACWPWTGQRIVTGYGRFTITTEKGKTRQTQAHRVVFELINGWIDDTSKVVGHHCDNPTCCNPRHLYLTDRKGNAHDALKKGRMSFGERHTSSKLKDSDVEYIRRNPDNLTHNKLAHKFKVSRPHITEIINGHKWKQSLDSDTYVSPPKGGRNIGKSSRNSKLTDTDVQFIRLNPGGLSHLALAKQYGVARSQITRIINRDQWAHLPDFPFFPLGYAFLTCARSLRFYSFFLSAAAPEPSRASPSPRDGESPAPTPVAYVQQPTLFDMTHITEPAASAYDAANAAGESVGAD